MYIYFFIKIYFIYSVVFFIISSIISYIEHKFDSCRARCTLIVFKLHRLNDKKQKYRFLKSFTLSLVYQLTLFKVSCNC